MMKVQSLPNKKSSESEEKELEMGAPYQKSNSEILEELALQKQVEYSELSMEKEEK